MNEYGLSEAEIKIIKDQAARRVKMRHHYWKEYQSPCHMGKGVIFDPAIQRYYSMRLNMVEFFKHTTKTGLIAFGFTIFPMTVYALLLKTTRDAREHEFRTGQVAYRDREGKIM